LDTVKRHIEALLFAAPQPVSIDELCKVLEESFGSLILADFVEEKIQELVEKYLDEEYAFEIRKINNGFGFFSKAIYKDTITTYLKQNDRKKLSNASLEVLAIIAYRQPVTRHEIEEIRGVNCDFLLHKLLDKELIAIGGRSDGPGRPLLYHTSERFLNHFGLNSLDELPRLKELSVQANQLGDPDTFTEN
jgi:segregation and condensation protein B